MKDCSLEVALYSSDFKTFNILFQYFLDLQIATYNYST